jgi:hypothetical protein
MMANEFVSLYKCIADAINKGKMLNAKELSKVSKLTLGATEAAIVMLKKKRLIYSPKRDSYGPVYALGPVMNPTFDVETVKAIHNPKKGTKAVKKAKAWNQREDLVTKPRPIKISDDLEFVEIGPILAIEYESNKYDGKNRAYRHDVTKKRTLHVSTDGTVLIVKPGFKITKRGIEG